MAPYGKLFLRSGERLTPVQPNRVLQNVEEQVGTIVSSPIERMGILTGDFASIRLNYTTARSRRMADLIAGVCVRNGDVWERHHGYLALFSLRSSSVFSSL